MAFDKFRPNRVFSCSIQVILEDLEMILSGITGIPFEYSGEVKGIYDIKTFEPILKEGEDYIVNHRDEKGNYPSYNITYHPSILPQLMRCEILDSSGDYVYVPGDYRIRVMFDRPCQPYVIRLLIDSLNALLKNGLPPIYHIGRKPIELGDVLADFYKSNKWMREAMSKMDSDKLESVSINLSRCLLNAANKVIETCTRGEFSLTDLENRNHYYHVVNHGTGLYLFDLGNVNDLEWYVIQTLYPDKCKDNTHSLSAILYNEDLANLLREDPRAIPNGVNDIVSSLINRINLR